MKTLTPAELGLPWKPYGVLLINDASGDDILEAVGEAGEYTKITRTAFAIHAANTYHEREQLLKECLD